MKKQFLLLFIFTSLLLFSQTSLNRLFKIEAGFQGLNLGYEQPLNEKLLLDLNAGVGGVVWIPEGSSISYRLGTTASQNYFSPFLRAQLRYYFNRDARAAKEHSLENNAGSFWGIQTKMVLNSEEADVFVTDAHFGQQLPLGKRWIYRYHLGLGFGINGEGYGAFYPAIGSSFGYVF